MVSLREEAFKSVSAQGPLSRMSEVHGDFSNKYLPSTSGSQTRDIAGHKWGTLEELCMA